MLDEIKLVHAGRSSYLLVALATIVLVITCLAVVKKATFNKKMKYQQKIHNAYIEKLPP